MKKIITVVILMTSSLNLLSQINIVPNPSFENYTSCPNTTSNFFPLFWFTLGGDVNSQADFFNECCTIPYYLGGVSIPKSCRGYQFSNTGEAYVGVADNVLNPFYPYNERISVKLSDSLKPNVCYSVSFFISLADTVCWAFDDIGALFTKDSLFWPSNPPPVGWPFLTPQASNSKGNILSDKIHWTKISGSFVATGGEKYLTIGPFRAYDSTTFYQFCSNNYFTYYFIDDVSVYPCNTPVYAANAGEDVVICIGDSVQIGSSPRAEYLYAWDKAQGLSDTAIANPWVKPTVTSTYCLHQKDFKFDETVDCVTVTVDDCDANTISVINAFTPNNDGKNDYFYIKGTNISTVHLKIINRWGQLLYEATGEKPGWDGKYNGNYVSPGVYYYIAEVIFKNGEIRNKAGSIQLIR